MLGGCRGIVGSRRSAAAASGRDLGAQRAIRRKDAVVADEVDAGFGNECREAGHQIERLEEHLGGAIAVRGFERVSHQAP